MEKQQSVNYFEDFVMDMVNSQARELIGKAGYRRSDLEDIKQDLIVDLLERLPQYDPAKSDYKLFVACVLDRKGCNLIRHRKMERRDHRCEECSLNEEIYTGESQEPVQRFSTMDQDEHDILSGKYQRSAAERQQLKLDLATVLSKVSPELRQAALLLQSRTVTQAARDLGVPRSTFRDTYLEPLREFFTAQGINFYIF